MEKSEANIFDHPSIQNQAIYVRISWSKDLDQMTFLCISQNTSSSIFTIFSSRPSIMVTMIKLKKIGILLLLNLHKMAKMFFVLKLVILPTSLISLMLLISPTLKHFLSLAIPMVVKLLILTTCSGCEVAEFSNFSRLCSPFRH